LAPDKTVPNNAVIYCHILTLEKASTLQVYYFGFFYNIGTRCSINSATTVAKVLAIESFSFCCHSKQNKNIKMTQIFSRQERE
jgi:hypothetical protein